MNTFQGAAVYSSHVIFLLLLERWMSTRSCLGRRHPQWAAQPVRSQPDTLEPKPGLVALDASQTRPQQGQLLLRFVSHKPIYSKELKELNKEFHTVRFLKRPQHVQPHTGVWAALQAMFTLSFHFFGGHLSIATAYYITSSQDSNTACKQQFLHCQTLN